jgi:dCMP deaminase
MQNSVLEWDQRFLDLAKQISTWSKDPSKKVGAVAVGKNKEILAQGYNGFPRGINDSFTRLHDREEKYKYVVHAEMNVIYNACHNGVSLDGSTIYVYGLPVCHECAKGIIQTGIHKVVMSADDVSEKWAQSFRKTENMFKEAGVIFYTI